MAIILVMAWMQCAYCKEALIQKGNQQWYHSRLDTHTNRCDRSPSTLMSRQFEACIRSRCGRHVRVDVFGLL